MPSHVLSNAHLVPGVSLDLGELEFGVVGVHGANLLLSGCAEDLDDLYQLVHSRVSREDWLAQQQLCKHASCTPDVWTINGGTELPHADCQDRDQYHLPKCFEQ